MHKLHSTEVQDCRRVPVRRPVLSDRRQHVDAVQNAVRTRRHYRESQSLRRLNFIPANKTSATGLSVWSIYFVRFETKFERKYVIHHLRAPCLPVWHGIGNRRSVRRRKAQIFKHFLIRTSIIEAQVWRERLLLCRAESLEWSSFCSSKTYWYVYFQKATENSSYKQTLAYNYCT